MNIYKNLARRVLFQFDPENVHNKTLMVGKFFGRINNPLFENIGRCIRYKNKKLATKLFGICFENPIGLAAGYDKNAEIVSIVHYAGFGFEEVGSATAEAWEGNKKPRLFRIPQDEGIINRMGLNNEGIDKIAAKLKKSKIKIPYFVNITKTSDKCMVGKDGIKDIIYSFERAYFLGVGTVINASCPNTIDGKTFEQPKPLESLLSRIYEIRQSYSWKPILLKISPDIEDIILENDIKICKDYEINGFVICNTTTGRKGLKTSKKTIDKIGNGGLSGKQLKEKSNKLIKRVYELKEEEQIIIGCGGIFSAEDAFEKVKLGANLIEVLTALPYEGPFVANSINKGLAGLLERNRFSKLADAVGYNAEK